MTLGGLLRALYCVRLIKRACCLPSADGKPSGCRKTMLQKKDNRAAGELEGAKAPLEIELIAIKNA